MCILVWKPPISTIDQSKPKKRQWAKDKVLQGRVNDADRLVDQRQMQENRTKMMEERAMRQKGIVSQRERFPNFEVCFIIGRMVLDAWILF